MSSSRPVGMLGFSPTNVFSLSPGDESPDYDLMDEMQSFEIGSKDNSGFFLPKSVEEDSYMDMYFRRCSFPELNKVDRDEEQFHALHEELRYEIRRINDDGRLDNDGRRLELEVTLRKYQNTLLQMSRRKSLEHTPAAEDENKATFYDEVRGILGCPHYIRNCKLECSVCKKYYTCRHCHDTLVGLHHKMNIRDSRSMLCMICKKKQGIAKRCKKCKNIMAGYFCKKCNFFSDDDQYEYKHCDECGTCRKVGKGEKMEHCCKCGICMKLGHECLDYPIDQSSCSVCNEELKYSMQEIILPPNCGHPQHEKCFDKLISSNNSIVPCCPICRKSLLTKVEQELLSSKYDKIVEGTELPRELQSIVVNMYCNDCQRVVGGSKWHYYFKCPICGGYNTRIE